MISFYSPQMVATIDTTTTHTVENDVINKEKEKTNEMAYTYLKRTN